MGLTVALTNALSGMRIGQGALDVVSRNVANSGTPGYHRQSLSVIDTLGAHSSYAREGALTRAFDQTLQNHYTRSTSESGFANVRASVLDRLQVAFGKPGTAGSLDTAFSAFQSGLSALATSPDNYATRAQAVASAQTMASTLNDLSNQVQALRREVEGRIEAGANDLNLQLAALEKINVRLADLGLDPSSRAALLDQRDRLIARTSEMVDLRVDYRGDGTVALMTRSGVGLLDGRASVFEFQSAGTLSATALFDTDTANSQVGRLALRSSSGLTLDLVQQSVFRSGEMAGLIELRDSTLVQAQSQLDEIAGAVALAMSTVETQGRVVNTGTATGYEIDLSNVRNGNDFFLEYSRGSTDLSLKVVNVGDSSKLPMDYVDASGQRVVGMNFSDGIGTVASQLQDILGPGFNVTNPSGAMLHIVDDGTPDTTDIMGLTTRTTVAGNKDAGLGLSLFVDTGGIDFTNSLDGAGQRLGFASRISVNPNILVDSTLMVQYQTGSSLGDASRPNYLSERLDSMTFALASSSSARSAFRITGNVSALISQTINFQGDSAASAASEADSHALSLETLTQRMDTEYGVDIDEEMARLMELQNAFAANGRVVSVVQELLNQLLQI